MSTNNKDYNIGAKIAKQISNIQDNMTMNDNFNEPKVKSDKPCCPYCGSENIDTVSDITAEEGSNIAYYCNNCNGYFITPQFNRVNNHQITAYNTKEERDKDYASGAMKEDLSLIESTICELMAEKGFTRTNQVIDFLAKHYQETKDIVYKKKHRTSPGKMTIDDVEKYIKVRAYPNSPCGHITTNASITITYVKAFTETMDSIDTATFICPSINNLKYQWIEFLRKTGLQEDCIASFSVDISIWDRAYIESISSAIDSLIDTIYVDDENITNKKITEEDRQEILKNILGSGYFEGSDKIIYPHIITAKDPKSEIFTKSVKRYWGEE